MGSLPDAQILKNPGAVAVAVLVLSQAGLGWGHVWWPMLEGTLFSLTSPQDATKDGALRVDFAASHLFPFLQS